MSKTEKEMHQTSIYQPALLSDDEVALSLESQSLPFDDSLSRVGRCIVAYCLSGEAHLEVNLVPHCFTKTEILVIFPSQIVEQKAVSPDFKVMYFSLASLMYQEVIFRFPPEFIRFLHQHFYYKVGTDRLSEEQIRFAVIAQKFSEVENICRREILQHMFRIFFLELYDKIRRDELLHPTTLNNRKTALFEQFSNLVMQNFAVRRDVGFYADRLCISAKYLSIIAFDLSGSPAKQWIDDYVVLELKIRFKSTRDSIQQIADEMHFADQAFLCKYFKLRTGLAPGDFRKMAWRVEEKE